MKNLRFILPPTLAWVAFLMLFSLPASAQPVVFDVTTNHGGDTIYLGNPAELVFWVDAGPHELIGIVFSYRYVFTGGVTVDEMVIGDNYSFSPYSAATFATLGVNPYYAAKEPQDSVFLCGTSFGGRWTGQHEFARIRLEVTDTGTVTLDSIMLPPANHTEALDTLIQSAPLDWRPGPIVVVPCPFKVGDLNGSETITLADIILLVNYVFKGGGRAPAAREDGRRGLQCDDHLGRHHLSGELSGQGRAGTVPVLHSMRRPAPGRRTGGAPPCTCTVRRI